MLSQKFVFCKSKNFTSDNKIQMPPTIPVNHYSGPRNQQNRTKVLFYYPMLIVYNAPKSCLKHSNLLTVNELEPQQNTRPKPSPCRRTPQKEATNPHPIKSRSEYPVGMRPAAQYTPFRRTKRPSPEIQLRAF